MAVIPMADTPTWARGGEPMAVVPHGDDARVGAGNFTCAYRDHAHVGAGHFT